MTSQALDHRRVADLREAAAEVCGLCRTQTRRPFIVELAGTPKAGKTTVLGVLKDFFKQAGFRVTLMRERAADCPIPMKGHFFFNTWTSATMLAQVLAELDTECDILLLDRGFFDSLVWLELQDRRGQLTSEEKRVFEEFMLLERWRTLTDLTVLLFAEPEVAMKRENLGRLIPRTGSIMNPDALRDYNGVLRDVAARHEAVFDVLPIDANGSESALQTALAVLQEVVPRMRAWADPEILALPRALVETAFGAGSTLSASDCDRFLAAATDAIVHRRRSALEIDDGFVQLVGSAAFRYRGEYLLFERSPKDAKYDKFGTHTLWHRCHVENRSGEPLLATAQAQLEARIRDDLHLSRLGSLEPRGALWSHRDDERTHLGLAFEVELRDRQTAESLLTKEFRRGERAPLIRTEFCTLDELKGWQGLETWSRNAARDGLLEGRRGGPTSPTS